MSSIVALRSFRSTPSPLCLWPYTIHRSNLIVSKKSSFLAYASCYTASDDLSQFCTYAWSTGDTHSRRSGHCDGGEKGAGLRLARLLEVSRSDDVAVVVWRWYGGVKLGTERWKAINTVAVEALENGCWINQKR